MSPSGTHGPPMRPVEIAAVTAFAAPVTSGLADKSMKNRSRRARMVILSPLTERRYEDGK